MIKDLNKENIFSHFFKKEPKSQGQTLIEMLLAVSIAALVLIGLTKAVVIGLRNARFAKNQSLATQYAQETMEKIRVERDQNNWNGFKSNCTFGLSPLSDSNFIRDLQCECYIDENPTGDCSNVDVNKMKVTVTISWGSHQSELISYFTKWNK